nr:hypothetical protein CFP56_70583 [Quercus suber]
MENGDLVTCLYAMIIRASNKKLLTDMCGPGLACNILAVVSWRYSPETNPSDKMQLRVDDAQCPCCNAFSPTCESRARGRRSTIGVGRLSWLTGSSLHHGRRNARSCSMSVTAAGKLFHAILRRKIKSPMRQA